MRAAPLFAAALIAPAAWGQPAPDAAGAARPPERPASAGPGPQPSSGEVERPPPAQPSDATAAARDAAGGPPAPEPPSGPPQREALRESDFDFSACLLALHMMGADYEAGPEITGKQRDCGIARPVTLRAALPGLALEGAPPMRCETARALGWWLRDHVLPAAARLPGAPRPVALALGSTYQCRGVAGGDGAAKLSEHAFGNALDIAAFRVDTGEPIDIAQAGGSDLRGAFLAAVRGAACLYFTTVLGPGSDAAHGDHLHLDVKARRGGYRICQ